MKAVLTNSSAWNMDYVLSYKWTAELPITQLSSIYLPRTDGASFRLPAPPAHDRLPRALSLYTHCDLTPSNRVAMISALMKVFPIDSRGSCLRNKPPIEEDGTKRYMYDRKGHHNKVLRLMVATQHLPWTNSVCR